MALVCLCHGVSEGAVVAAMSEGATTVEQVGDRCAAGTRCRGCRPTVEQLIAAHLVVPGAEACAVA
jgi:NAD(P)H-nitrite reductase large subunit